MILLNCNGYIHLPVSVVTISLQSSDDDCDVPGLPLLSVQSHPQVHPLRPRLHVRAGPVLAPINAGHFIHGISCSRISIITVPLVGRRSCYAIKFRVLSRKKLLALHFHSEDV